MVVPGERRNTLALADAKPAQRVGNAFGAGGDTAPVAAMQWTFQRARDDLGARMIALCIVEQ